MTIHLFGKIGYLKQIIMTKKPALILSYPRSSNTWVRYCLEALTKRPTLGVDVQTAKIGKPLHLNISGLKVDNNTPITIKSHDTKRVKGKFDGLILLVRNYKEVIIRHGEGRKVDIGLLNRATSNNEASSNYIELLQYYDAYKGAKLLLYYEDIISNLEPELVKLMEFFGVSDANIKGFMDKLPEHRTKSLNFYGVGKSGGDKTVHHSNRLSPQDKKQWDNNLKTRFPIIFEKYLKRYEESEA